LIPNPPDNPLLPSHLPTSSPHGPHPVSPSSTARSAPAPGRRGAPPPARSGHSGEAVKLELGRRVRPWPWPERGRGGGGVFFSRAPEARRPPPRGGAVAGVRRPPSSIPPPVTSSADLRGRAPVPEQVDCVVLLVFLAIVGTIRRLHCARLKSSAVKLLYSSAGAG
jgi:hypothetical protein